MHVEEGTVDTGSFRPGDISKHLKLSSCTSLRHLSLEHRTDTSSYPAVWRWLACVLERAPPTLAEVHINCAFSVRAISSPEEDTRSDLDDALDRIRDLQSVVINIGVYHSDPYCSSTHLSMVLRDMPKTVARGVLRTELTIVPWPPWHDGYQWLGDF